MKSKEEMERYKHLKAEFQKQQGEIRKPSLAINAKKQRKTTKWERLEISSRDKMGTIKDRNLEDRKEEILQNPNNV